MSDVELFQLSSDLIPCRRSDVYGEFIIFNLMGGMIMTAENMFDLIAFI